MVSAVAVAVLVLAAARAADSFAFVPPCSGHSLCMQRSCPSASLRGGGARGIAGLRASAVSELTEAAISKEVVATLEQQGYVVIQVFSLISSLFKPLSSLAQEIVAP